jgi:adenosylcobyric acid synthase
MRLVAARTHSGISFQGYEIHMGDTRIDAVVPPFALLENGTPDGVRLPRIVGTYLHGAFENREVLEEVLQHRLDNDVPASREIQYERMADWFAEHVNQEVFAAEYLRR